MLNIFNKASDIFSHQYKKKKSYPFSNLLFYTYANKNYFPFAILYPIFVLSSNKDTVVEIALSNERAFRKKYSHLIKFYDEFYPNKVFYHQLDMLKRPKIKEGTYRFITQPRCKSNYVYIGDVDIIILEEILKKHLRNIEKNNLDFSNVKRKRVNKLTGLHFIEYDKMYPLKKIFNLTKADEAVLFDLMKAKGYKIPDENIDYRPIHGLHISYFSRPPYQSLTTNDRIADFPTWYNNSDECKNFIKAYQNIRFSNNVKKFMSFIKDDNSELRRIIQIIDSTTFYAEKNNL